MPCWKVQEPAKQVLAHPATAGEADKEAVLGGPGMAAGTAADFPGRTDRAFPIRNPMNYYGHGSDIFGILESEYGISRAKATRCMRYSIAIAWQSQENKEFHALFKSYGDEFPPPVSEFIFRSAFEIRSAQIRESETDNSISSVLKP